MLQSLYLFIIISKAHTAQDIWVHVRHTCRPVATGGGRGGLSPPGKNWAPLGCAVPFAVTIGIEVYPPPGILSAPLLTIPGYGAAYLLPNQLHAFCNSITRIILSVGGMIQDSLLNIYSFYITNKSPTFGWYRVVHGCRFWTEHRPYSVA